MNISKKIDQEFGLLEKEAIEEYRGISNILKINYLLLAETILELTGPIIKGKILDLGSGLGILSQELAKRYLESEVIGLDISEEMTKKAENLAKAENLNNLKFMVMDAERLGFEDNSIDLIASHGSLHHWGKPKEVFKEIYRVLKNKGLGFISDLRRDAPKEVVDEVKNFLGIHQRKGFLNSIKASYLYEEIKNMLSDLGRNNFEIKEQKFSRNVILKNLEIIKKTNHHSKDYNQLYLNIILRK